MLTHLNPQSEQHLLWAVAVFSVSVVCALGAQLMGMWDRRLGTLGAQLVGWALGAQLVWCMGWEAWCSWSPAVGYIRWEALLMWTAVGGVMWWKGLANLECSWWVYGVGGLAFLELSC